MTAQSQDYGELRSQGVRVEGADVPSTAANRYTFERTDYGFDVVDTLTGDVVGVESTEAGAAKTCQRMSALMLANAMRVERCRIKREIHAAETTSRETCAAVLEDNPPAIASMRVEALLRAVRRHYQDRRRMTLRYAGCSEAKVIRELSDRQRARLCEALRMDLWTLQNAVRLMR